jgi:CPA2 family monovalent cation:H+ antiporter-2
MSPSLGAFVAGLLLAETPFAAQIRADVASIRTILVTLFFAAIGMLFDPSWIIDNYLIAIIGITVVFLLKSPIILVVSRLTGFSAGCSMSTAVCLFPVSEFSFVLAQTAVTIGVIGEDTFKMVVAVTVLTLLIAPYLIHWAPAIGALLERPDIQLKKKNYRDTPDHEEHSSLEGHIVIVGFGPAGLAVAEGLVGEYKDRLMIVDLNPSNADWAKNLGVDFHVGDARQREFLEHLHISRADTVIITLPDPAACRQVIHLCKALSPEVRLLVRARYHIFRWEFEIAGAERVIDEESEVGRQLAKAFTRDGELDH